MNWNASVDYSIEKKKLYEVVADKLEAGILSDRSQIGTKLPSEQTLADSFGVSRNIVREALKLLNARGLVELRTGEGAFSVKPRTETMAALLNRIVTLESIDQSQVMDMRILLETKAASLAAENATAEDIEILRLNIAQMELTQDDNIRVDTDLMFHMKLAEMTGNVLMAFFIGTMIDMLRPLMQISGKWSSAKTEAEGGHHAILDAIVRHDPDGAGQAMHAHLGTFAAHLSLVQEGKA